MPKRKHSEDDFEYLSKKLKKLERKVRRAKRRRTRSPSLLTSPDDSHRMSEPEDKDGRDPVSLEECIIIEEVTQPTSNEVPGSVPPPVSMTEESNTVTQNTELTIPELDKDLLDILGDDPTKTNPYGVEIQKDLAIRLEHWATTGLTKETRKDLKDKYLIPINCKLTNAPALNAEVKAALPDAVAKRDKAIEIKQGHLASAISSLSMALTRLLSAKDKDADLIKYITDACRILCDYQYNDSIIRRNFILSTLKKDMKEQLQITKVDNFLFGQNFAETLKVAKAITKSGADLKANTTPKPQHLKKPAAGPSKPLNWKGPLPPRRQPEPQRTKEPASRKNPQSHSSRQLQQRQQRNRR